MTEQETTDMDVFEAKKLIEERNKKIADRDQAASKKKLLNDINKKIRTTMIGALASFEETFGHLWGHNKSIKSLTPQEKEMRELWDKTRTEVLDKGNTQARMAMSEIAQYTLKWNKYHVEFVVKNGKGN